MSERYSNKRVLYRERGRYRKAEASDIGIAGVCPKCNGIMLTVYAGDSTAPFIDPSLFVAQCYTCNPEEASK